MNKIRLSFAICTALAAMSASPVLAAAAGPTGRADTSSFGKCMYSTHQGLAAALLGATSQTSSDQAFERLSNERTCFARLPSNVSLDNRVVAFPKDLIRGMLAEQALRGSGELATLQPLPLQQKRYVRPWFAATGRNSAVDEMAVCIADTNPQGIAALIATEPESTAESFAFGNLNEALGKCLTAGTRLQADRFALRAALADALYQRLRNPALSTTEATEAVN